MTKRLLGIMGGVVFITLLWALPIAAQRYEAARMPAQAIYAPLAVAPSQVAFVSRSGATAWLDSNKSCAPNYVGPHAMWIVVGVTNNATEPLTNAVATLSGFTGPYFTLTADPVRYIGTLQPAETYYGYWYVQYACTANRVDTYTVTVSAANLTGTAQYARTLTTATAIDTANEATVLSNVAAANKLAVGQIYTQTVRYSLSKSNDRVILQPTGDSGFADACFRLLAAEVTRSTVTGIAAGTRHRLYFDTGISSGQVTMVYFWQALCYAETTSTPWAVVESPAKYSNNYGVLFSTFPTASLSLSMTSAITPTRLTQADAVTYTVRFSNTFTRPVELDTITVTLASGLSFNDFVTATSDVLPDNSSLYPAPGAPGTLVWRGKPGVSYSVPAATAGGSGILELVFKVNVPGINGTYTQQARGQAGKLNVGLTSNDITVDIPTAVTLASFEATPQEDAILVTWETASELDNVGFNLYRSAAAEGPYTRLNATLIPPQNPGSVMGSVYEWLDADVQPGVTYFYKLEDIDVRGVSTFHGPVSVTVVAAPTAVRVQHVAARAALFPVLLGGLAALIVIISRHRDDAS